MSHQRNNKTDGIFYEQLFLAEALRRGLDVCPAIGDYLPYDIVVMNGATSLRVQVKGTAGCGYTSSGKRNYQYTVARGRLVKQLNNEFDIFAGYARSHSGNHWYIIPKKEIRYKTVKIYPDNLNSKGKYEKFRNNWDAFKNTGLKK